MLGGGKPRDWLTELTTEGNRPLDEVGLESAIGCHTGQFVHLNVTDPEPGQTYVWERREGRAQMQARQRGGRPVGASDPEMIAMNTIMAADGATSLDSTSVYGDVILYKYPEDAIRRIRENESVLNNAALRDGAGMYAEQARAIETQLSQGLPTRFARKDHGLAFENLEGNVVDRWAPEGVPREG